MQHFLLLFCLCVGVCIGIVIDMHLVHSLHCLLAVVCYERLGPLHIVRKWEKMWVEWDDKMGEKVYSAHAFSYVNISCNVVTCLSCEILMM